MRAAEPRRLRHRAVLPPCLRPHAGLARGNVQSDEPPWGNHAHRAVCCALRGLQTTKFRGGQAVGPGMDVPIWLAGRCLPKTPALVQLA